MTGRVRTTCFPLSGYDRSRTFRRCMMHSPDGTHVQEFANCQNTFSQRRDYLLRHCIDATACQLHLLGDPTLQLLSVPQRKKVLPARSYPQKPVTLRDPRDGDPLSVPKGDKATPKACNLVRPVSFTADTILGPEISLERHRASPDRSSAIARASISPSVTAFRPVSDRTQSRLSPTDAAIPLPLTATCPSQISERTFNRIHGIT
jgi:hypothetical protein